MEKSICIIGAGSAGICAARRCYESGFSDITVFEQSDKIGGLWNYTDEINVHSSMYDKLTTNIPRELIGFKDFPVPDYNKSGRSFFPRDEFLQYLNEFAQPIKSFIKFDHRVINVTREENRWKTDVQNSNSDILTYYFDVIFICNGVCTVPDFPSYAEEYTRPSMHSHNYRKADIFQGKTIAVIGAGLSGTDICEQVAGYANKVYLLYKQINIFQFEFPENVIKLPHPIGADENTIHLSDGSTLSDLDMVIYCTGYRYSFPFLENNILQVKHEGKMVSPLFEHVAHKDYLDSFFVIGLNFWAISSMLFEHQIAFAIALIKGEAKGFTKDDVENWENKRIKDLQENGHSLKHFHYFEHPNTYNQWGYFEQLSRYTNSPPWIPNVFIKIAMHFFGEWKTQPCEYRKVDYKILNDEEFEYKEI